MFSDSGSDSSIASIASLFLCLSQFLFRLYLPHRNMHSTTILVSRRTAHRWRWFNGTMSLVYTNKKQEGQDNLSKYWCTRHKFLSQIRQAFFHSKSHEIQIFFAVAWLIQKENTSYCVQNFHLVWNKSRYERLYFCLFLLIALICNSFGSRTERSGALQLLIKMLIRWCVMWEGLSFYIGTSCLIKSLKRK